MLRIVVAVLTLATGLSGCAAQSPANEFARQQEEREAEEAAKGEALRDALEWRISECQVNGDGSTIFEATNNGDDLATIHFEIGFVDPEDVQVETYRASLKVPAGRTAQIDVTDASVKTYFQGGECDPVEVEATTDDLNDYVDLLR